MIDYQQITQQKSIVFRTALLNFAPSKSNLEMENKPNTDSPVVRTKMKFARSPRTGFTVGFVSRNPKTGAWRGVRQNSAFPKKVCVLSKHLVPYTLLNKLYDVTMVPMKNGDGYVVVEAEPVAFTVMVNSTHVPRLIYRVEAKFGEKTIIFDPMEGQRASVRSLSGAVEALSKRTDVKDLPQAVEEFANAAKDMLDLYETEMPAQAATKQLCHA